MVFWDDLVQFIAGRQQRKELILEHNMQSLLGA